ncbi:MAG TPA: o-succinylbenzoate synthase, partial [Cytophagales bacterium]|nr:o-succinylbenzoate synthase [Cytophagales bacterium]
TILLIANSLSFRKEQVLLQSSSDLNAFPALRFAFETALLDLKNGGERKIFKNDFSLQGAKIPINGLIWMGSKTFMLKQMEEKLMEGFSCLKLKIGALDFQTEKELLASIRSSFSAKEISIRLDANGAFSVSEALEKLNQLSDFEIHSVEQPIKPGQWQEMAKLCALSPIPVALDEELIGVYGSRKSKLLDAIKPHYIILKPSLLGGFAMCDEWISLAEKQGIDWWITSALESNIGLNAICQYTFEKTSHKREMPQGLGTGSLYHNNIKSPLCVQKGHIHYSAKGIWGY